MAQMRFQYWTFASLSLTNFVSAAQVNYRPQTIGKQNNAREQHGGRDWGDRFGYVGLPLAVEFGKKCPPSVSIFRRPRWLPTKPR